MLSINTSNPGAFDQVTSARRVLESKTPSCSNGNPVPYFYHKFHIAAYAAGLVLLEDSLTIPFNQSCRIEYFNSFSSISQNCFYVWNLAYLEATIKLLEVIC